MRVCVKQYMKMYNGFCFAFAAGSQIVAMVGDATSTAIEATAAERVSLSVQFAVSSRYDLGEGVGAEAILEFLSGKPLQELSDGERDQNKAGLLAINNLKTEFVDEKEYLERCELLDANFVVCCILLDTNEQEFVTASHGRRVEMYEKARKAAHSGNPASLMQKEDGNAKWCTNLLMHCAEQRGVRDVLLKPEVFSRIISALRSRKDSISQFKLSCSQELMDAQASLLALYDDSILPLVAETIAGLCENYAKDDAGLAEYQTVEDVMALFKS